MDGPCVQFPRLCFNIKIVVQNGSVDRGLSRNVGEEARDFRGVFFKSPQTERATDEVSENRGLVKIRWRWVDKTGSLVVACR